MTSVLELDVTAILPQLIEIKAGEHRYAVQLDVKSVDIARCSRWIREAEALAETLDEARDEEHDKFGIRLAAHILRVTYEEAENLGGPARYRLLNFFAIVSFMMKVVETPTAKPSRLRASSKER